MAVMSYFITQEQPDKVFSIALYTNIKEHSFIIQTCCNADKK